ncbi:MAG: zf-HC2 domain-containing protein [Thiogranum sp.]|nr:zf-HC2 domain-containing protein [Thiogranum sp.]
MLSCKDASVIVSDSLDRKLSLHERLSLKLHLMMCNACQRMAGQMQILHAVSLYYRTATEEDSHLKQVTLSKEASERILERLQSAADAGADDDQV